MRPNQSVTAQGLRACAPKVSPLRLLALLLAGCLLAAGATHPSTADASQLQIQFTGLELDYDGSSLFDAAFHNTVRAGDPAQSDALSSMSFYLDNTLVGTVLTNNIFADLYIAGITNIPIGGGVVNSSGNGGTFGVDLLTSNSLPGWGLALNVDTMQFFYTGSQIAISLSGLATSINTQMLPFALAFDPNLPVTISITSASLSGITSSGGYVTGLHANGAGVVAGVYVPEPSTLVLLAVGAAAAAVHSVRRRRR